MIRSPALMALQFYKLHHEGRARLWFLLLLAAFAATYWLPFADSHFDAFLQDAWTYLQGQGPLPTMSLAQRAFLYSQGVVRVLAIVAGFDYLRVMQGEAASSRDGREIHFSLSVRQWLKLMAIGILFACVYVVSAPFYFVPYVVLLSFYTFAPIYVIERREPFGNALRLSRDLGRGRRLMIAFAYLFLMSLFVLVNVVVADWGQRSVPMLALGGGFVFAWGTLARARLIGLLYDQVSRHPSDRPFWV